MPRRADPQLSKTKRPSARQAPLTGLEPMLAGPRPPRLMQRDLDALLKTRPKDPAVRAQLAEGYLSLLSCIDGNVRRRAAKALGRVGKHSPKAIPALCDALNTGDESFRSTVAAALKALAPEGAIAGAKRIIAITKAPGDAASRRAVLRYLAQLGPSAAEIAVPAAIGFLSDREPKVRYDACGEVAGMTEWLTPEQERAALKGLIICLDDPEREVQSEAHRAVGLLRAEAEAVVLLLAPRLKASDDWTRHYSACTFRWLAPRAPKAALPVMIEALRSPNASVADCAAVGLAGIGPAAAPAIPNLLREFVSKRAKRDTYYWGNLQRALTKIGFEHVRPFLNDPKLGPAARAAIDAGPAPY